MHPRTISQWYVIAVAPQVPLLLVGIGLLMGHRGDDRPGRRSRQAGRLRRDLAHRARARASVPAR